MTVKHIFNDPFGIPLSKYKICKVGSNHYIVIGGSNKFLYTDNKMIKWHLGRTDNTLTNHTLTSVNDGCVVIGGIKNQFNISNEIAAIKFLDNGQIRLRKSEFPVPIYNHTTTHAVVNDEDILIVTGGRIRLAGKVSTQDNLTNYNMSTWKVSRHNVEQLDEMSDFPYPIQHHSAINIGTQIYIFGGMLATDQRIPKTSHSIYSIELDPKKEGYGIWRLSKLCMPKHLSGHTVLTHNNCILLIGGIDDYCRNNYNIYSITINDLITCNNKFEILDVLPTIVNCENIEYVVKNKHVDLYTQGDRPHIITLK